MDGATDTAVVTNGTNGIIHDDEDMSLPKDSGDEQQQAPEGEQAEETMDDFMLIDTNKLQERFKFFEDYKDEPKKAKPKRFDLPTTNTAKKMLGKFKELETQSSTETAPAGPKPLKRITPPRDEILNGINTINTANNYLNGKDRAVERDPNIVRASYKTEDIVPVEPEMARSLKAKFENWAVELDRENNNRNDNDESGEYVPNYALPSLDITKNLKAKFEAIRLENKPVERSKMRVNRFVAKRSASFAFSGSRADEKEVNGNSNSKINGCSSSIFAAFNGSGNHSAPEDELPDNSVPYTTSNTTSIGNSASLPPQQPSSTLPKKGGNEANCVNQKTKISTASIQLNGGLYRSRTTGSIRNPVTTSLSMDVADADVVNDSHDELPEAEQQQASKQVEEIKEDPVVIDTSKLQERFKFFEEFKEEPKEPKRFEMTPPREVIPDEKDSQDINRDPNVVRSSDVVNDLPTSDTAKKMLGKFKQLETQSSTETASAGPKPLKRITPPRDQVLNGNGTANNDQNGQERSPERDPNIVRASYKTEDVVPVEPEMARSLKAKFENWAVELDRDNNNKNETDDGEYAPSLDTTKNLKAKFEAIKFENKPIEKPKMRVNRFVQETSASQGEECSICCKRLYPLEKLEFNGVKLHKTCFKCTHCSSSLRIENYTYAGGKFYCLPHFKQLFMAKGNYDEGFGREQHKEKWNSRTSSRNQTPDDLEVESDTSNSTAEQAVA